MLESMLEGLQQVMRWDVLAVMLLAVFLGNFFGAVPGLGGVIGLALMIPFVFGMEPFLGVALLLAFHSVINTGASIPSILFAIPGSTGAIPTIIDGYPMTQQGRAGEAMGAQLAASAVGGVIGAVVLAGLIPLLRPIAMGFGSGELFMLIILGITFVVVISRENVSKGLMAALVGAGLGVIGLDPFTGVGRFTFGQLWLWDGIHLVSIALGLFALAEMIDLGARGRRSRIVEVEVTMRWSQLWEGTKAVYHHWWLALRTAVIGSFIGIIPGMGGDDAAWICYGHTVQTSKNKENFGKGDIRGVIGVETANNSKEGGALLPTIVFGIPGSTGMAMLMGAFLILGITPGPKMITEQLDLVWAMVFVLVIANIVGAATLYPISGYMAKLTFIRGSLLIPPILVLATVGTFLVRGRWQDVALALLFGLIGYGMKKWGYPRGPMILAFILGPLAEGYLHKALGTMEIAFLTRPVVLVLLVMVVLSIGYSVWNGYQERKKAKENPA